MNPPVAAGGIYLASDGALTLPPNDNRDVHETRPVIVISAQRPNVDASWKTALVIPTSSSTKLWTPYCVKLSAGTGGLDRKTWARVPAVQPFMKSALGKQIGVLPADRLEEIHARLLDYMGLLTAVSAD